MPGGPRKTTCSRRSTKPSSWRLYICSRRSDGWKEKSNSVSRLTTGSRLASAHRGVQTSVVAQLNQRAEQLLDRLSGRERRAIDAVEDGIECFECPRHAQIGEHLAQTIVTGRAAPFMRALL